jgi:hypothetical protein
MTARTSGAGAGEKYLLLPALIDQTRHPTHRIKSKIVTAIIGT